MRDFVLDASVLIQHVVTDVHTANVDALFEVIGSEINAHIPEFCLIECVNVIWKQVRFNNVPASVAMEQVENLQALNLTMIPPGGLLLRALEIGLKHQLPIYDAIYIAAAQLLQYPLITDDQKQAAVAVAEGISLILITQFEA